MTLLEYHRPPAPKVTERVLAAIFTIATLTVHGWIGVLWLTLFADNVGRNLLVLAVLLFVLFATALCLFLNGYFLFGLAFRWYQRAPAKWLVSGIVAWSAAFINALPGLVMTPSPRHAIVWCTLGEILAMVQVGAAIWAFTASPNDGRDPAEYRKMRARLRAQRQIRLAKFALEDLEKGGGAE